MIKYKQDVLRSLLNEKDELEYMYNFLNDSDKDFTIKGYKLWYSYILSEERCSRRTIAIKENLLKEIVKILIDRKQDEINDLLDKE